MAMLLTTYWKLLRRYNPRDGQYARDGHDAFVRNDRRGTVDNQ